MNTLRPFAATRSWVKRTGVLPRFSSDAAKEYAIDSSGGHGGCVGGGDCPGRDSRGKGNIIMLRGHTVMVPPVSRTYPRWPTFMLVSLRRRLRSLVRRLRREIVSATA